jgi:hypothetical protein
MSVGRYVDGVVDPHVGRKVNVHRVLLPRVLVPHYVLFLLLTYHLNRQERVNDGLGVGSAVFACEERKERDVGDEGFIDDDGELYLEVEVFEDGGVSSEGEVKTLAVLLAAGLLT